MNKASVYSSKGTKMTPVALPKGFAKEGSRALLTQAIHIYEAGNHIGLAKAKTRGEVNRTKKKLYKQKGTGGARHGSRSAPIFVGGGKAHGPRPLERSLALPLKMRRKALAIALDLKLNEGQIILVVGLAKIQKTKEAAALIKKLGIKGKISFVLNEQNRALANLKNSQVLIFRNLNAYQIYFGGTLIFTADIFEKKEGVKK